MKYRRIVTSAIILILTFGLLGLYLSSNHTGLQKLNTEGVENLSSPTASENDPKPQLRSEYVVNELDSEWNILISEDFGIIILIPNASTVNRGGGFETKQLGIDISGSLANAVVVIDTGYMLSRTTEEIAREITMQTGPANFTYTEPELRVINNATGYETFVQNEKNTFSYHFVTTVEDRYIDLWYYYPWAGSETTGNEKSVVSQVISSLELLE